MAGESAHEMARLAREKARVHRQKAEALSQKADELEKYAAKCEAGAAGEAATAVVLAGLPPEWVVLDDVRWPGRQRANLDHVVIGPGGIFVIDSKNWSGNVTLITGVLRQNGYAREREVAGVADAALDVARLVGPMAKYVEPVLCLNARELVGRAWEVSVRGTDNLLDFLLRRPTVLSPRDVREARYRISNATSWEATPSPAPSARRTARPARTASPRRKAKPRSRRSSSAASGALFGVVVAVMMLMFGPAILGALGTGVPTGIVPRPTGQATCQVSTSQAQLHARAQGRHTHPNGTTGEKQSLCS